MGVLRQGGHETHGETDPLGSEILNGNDYSKLLLLGLGVPNSHSVGLLKPMHPFVQPLIPPPESTLQIFIVSTLFQARLDPWTSLSLLSLSPSFSLSSSPCSRGCSRYMSWLASQCTRASLSACTSLLLYTRCREIPRRIFRESVLIVERTAGTVYHDRRFISIGSEDFKIQGNTNLFDSKSRWFCYFKVESEANILRLFSALCEPTDERFLPS